jgi:hypothetical protein
MIIVSVKKNEREISHEEKFVKSRRECIGNPGRFMKRLKQERFLTKRDARKLEVLQRRHHEHEKEVHWKRVKEEIEGAVRSGRMTRKQADAEYERIKKTQKQKEEVARELHREIEEEMRGLRIAVREGEISEEEARREGDEIRRNLEREIHAAHRRIDFEEPGTPYSPVNRGGTYQRGGWGASLGRDAQKNGIGREKDA